VVKPPEQAAGEPPRPPWHWVGFGAVATFCAWLPLAFLAQVFSARVVLVQFSGQSATSVEAAVAALGPANAWKLHIYMVLPPLFALLAGAAVGGYLVARHAVTAGIREATLGGVAAGGIAAALAAGGAGPMAVAVIPIAALGAWLGARVGFRRRMKPINM
jgi:hypothetical protein